MLKSSHAQMMELEKQYYLGKVLCTADPNDPAKFLKYKLNHIFIIFGFTGVGKDTIIDGFLKKNKKHSFVKFIRTMSRKKRTAELDMYDGFFIKKELFDYLKTHNRFFYYYKKYNGREFGYDILHLIFELTRSNIIMVGGNEKNYRGLLRGINSIFGNSIPITTIFINRPRNKIIEYLKKRGGSDKEIQNRILNIKRKWYKKPIHPTDYYIWNTNIKSSLEKFTAIIKENLEKK